MWTLDGRGKGNETILWHGAYRHFDVHAVIRVQKAAEVIINFAGLRVWYPRNSNKPHLESSQPEKDLTYTCLKTGMIQMIDYFFVMVTGERNAIRI
jgi:hypothetical protein